MSSSIASGTSDTSEIDQEDMFETGMKLPKCDAGGAKGGTTTPSAAQPDEVGDLIASSDKPSSPLPLILILPPDEHQQTMSELPTKSIQPSVSHDLGARVSPTDCIH